MDFSWGDSIGAPFKSTTLVHEALFKAPVTGNYRFTMSCDDSCHFRLSHEGDILDPASSELMLQRGSWTSYRDQFIVDFEETGD